MFSAKKSRTEKYQQQTHFRKYCVEEILDLAKKGENLKFKH